MNPPLKSKPIQTTPLRSRIVWAVDVRTGDDELMRRTGEAALSAFPASLILPVHCFRLSPETGRALCRGGERKRQAAAAIDAALTKMRSAHPDRILPAHVLSTRRRGREAPARAVLRYARRIRAAAVALSTHGRSGLQKALYGSFAEATLGRASMPALLVNPFCEASFGPLVGYRKVVFAADFSPACREPWRIAVAFARSIGAQAELFYHCPRNLASAAAGASPLGAGLIGFDAFTDCERELWTREEEAKSWLAEAASEGVPASLVVEKFSERTCDAIVDYLRTQDGAILAMSSQTPGWASALVGSVTRSAVRAVRCPVLAIPGGRRSELGRGWDRFRARLRAQAAWLWRLRPSQPAQRS